MAFFHLFAIRAHEHSSRMAYNVKKGAFKGALCADVNNISFGLTRIYVGYVCAIKTFNIYIYIYIYIF